MVEKLCTFLDSSSFIISSLPHYNLHKPIFTLLPNLQLLSPSPTCSTSITTTRTRRRSSRLLRLTVFCTPFSSSPSSLDFDIVSTSEGSDGSFVFRFGDASEVERIRELEESRKLEELRELEERSNEVSSVLEVFGGNDEAEVIVKTVVIEESDVKEECSDILPQLSETLVQSNDERDLQVDVLDTNGNESSTSALDSENVCVTENSIQEDHEENLTSTSILLSDDSLNIEGKILEENFGDESMFESGNVAVAVIEIPKSDEGGIQENVRTEAADIEDSVQAESVGLKHDLDSGNVCNENNGDDSMSDCGNLTDSVTEVPQSNGACKDDSQVNVSSKAASFEESAQAESIETPVMLNESSSISTLEPEISEVEVLIGDLVEVSDDEDIEVQVSSGDLTEVLGAEADIQLTGSHIIGRTTAMEDQIKTLEKKVEDQNGRSSLGEEVSTAKLCLSSGAALLPHPSKALAGGEESYFVTNLNWLGVADGVGQWSLEGSNPGVYARELMEHCGKIVSNSGGVSILKPVEVLERIVEEAQSPGSSTILLAYFDGQILHVANIGDSGFIIIRNGTVHRSSSPMHHDFHFPLQIAKGYDPSELVEEYEIELEFGDIVVTATDGLLDNLYMEEIASIVSKSVQAKINTQEIAKLLARRAQEVGKSAFGNSPFADSARAAGYKGFTGGAQGRKQRGGSLL
ncbi:PPM-type phosphatase domain-containing protein [Heracleum sosnowskyi]|uniref:Protein phosphatase n=1 Tax=Heracleum sosnowskyi TaxID=360622 RepID=A0AAD8H2N1_9APIA|nr:PPM-type phosphatase domain-containing protein [Heracleum sosnowskyi]